jgi:tryptophan-rich sensory protein
MNRPKQRVSDSLLAFSGIFFFLIALISAMAWTILLLFFERQNGRWMGLIGAWVAVVVLGAIWQAEAIAGSGFFSRQSLPSGSAPLFF